MHSHPTAAFAVGAGTLTVKCVTSHRTFVASQFHPNAQVGFLSEASVYKTPVLIDVGGPVQAISVGQVGQHQCHTAAFLSSSFRV